jgi:hypothetical protein
MKNGLRNVPGSGIGPTRPALPSPHETRRGDIVSMLPYPAESDVNDRGQPQNEVRNVFCRSYDGCLDLAVKKNWRSWTCGKCPLLSCETEKPTPDKFAHRRIREDWV